MAAAVLPTVLVAGPIAVLASWGCLVAPTGRPASHVGSASGLVGFLVGTDEPYTPSVQLLQLPQPDYVRHIGF